MSLQKPPLRPEDFPVRERFAYLDHAGVGPLPAPAAKAVAEAARAFAAEGGLAEPVQPQAVRAAAARLMGVPVSDVAFVKNTTEGLGFVANGLEWAEGDRVVVPDLEFPSVLYPWLALEERGVVVDRLAPVGPGRRVTIEAFEEAIAADPPPKLVATSWVNYGRGYRVDLEALAVVAHARGALVCVDVIQGLGVLPASLDAWGVDVAMAGAHKWLLGPAGIGVLYVRPSVLERLRPLEPGWASVAHRRQWDNLELVLDASARRLEGGSVNLLGLSALAASLELLEHASVPAIRDHVLALTERVCGELAEAGAEILSDRSLEGRSGIVTFALPGTDPARAVEALRAAGVVAAARGGGVRVSPHGYTTEEEIDRLVEAVRALRSGR
jgi:cysteine desulfurase/selenocysteine lyase